ncbi:uncharacterized protein TRIADDRAFT_57317 [Trichoplax adhaerens]|uniref:Uncharacterized protein n=1 Tax=Trichoplax adhaerens TaxID=10228 RepID=B3RZ40_TRIAD|nr:hypothetical protein TRIADDRAFT_57317 [Trichoplax adhaerens]EDV23776.1 hypothetical protein TRIADDRAFT_57317 [Trichoplax adhaerens]|eukprot:XP_002113302.1 hypothetical protein TRIADDRAFT_57317 [Trichoplax adhaerens]
MCLFNKQTIPVTAKVHILKEDVTYLQRLQLSGLRFPSINPAIELASSIESISNRLLSYMKEGYAGEIQVQRSTGHEANEMHLPDIGAVISNSDALYHIISPLTDLLPAFLQQFQQQQQSIKSTMALDDHSHSSYSYLSVPMLIMSVLQHTADNLSHSQRITYTLMSIKHNLSEDLLAVIAYGPIEVCLNAASMLLQFWPISIDDLNIEVKSDAWKSVICQTTSCFFSGNLPAVKISLDPVLSASLGSKPPPLYMCSKCSGKHHDLMPVYPKQETTSKVCEYKQCESNDKRAVVTCFSLSCTKSCGSRPMRLCSTCDGLIHGNLSNSERHIVQGFRSTNNTEETYPKYLIPAIIRLLLEDDHSNGIERLAREIVEISTYSIVSLDKNIIDSNLTAEAKKRSMYGLLLLNNMSIGRVVYSEFVVRWLSNIRDAYLETFINSLKPRHNYSLISKGRNNKDTAEKYKHALNCMAYMLSDKLINSEVWDLLMPTWMENIRLNIDIESLHPVESPLRKLFNPDVAHLFFGNSPYEFIGKKFKDMTANIQYQALVWLRLLSHLNIFLSPSWIIKMFAVGIASESFKQQSVSSTNHLSQSEAFNQELPASIVDDANGLLVLWEAIQTPDIYILAYEKPIGNYKALNLDLKDTRLSCFILMLDIIVKQIHLHANHLEETLQSTITNGLVRLVKNLMVHVRSSLSDHSCGNCSTVFRNCSHCKFSLMFYMLIHEIFNKVTGINERFSQDLHDDEAAIKVESQSNTDILPDKRPRRKSDSQPKSSTSNESIGLTRTSLIERCSKNREYPSKRRPFASSLKEKSSSNAALQVSRIRSISRHRRIDELLQVLKSIVQELQICKNSAIIYYQLQCIKLLLPPSEFISQFKSSAPVRDLIIKFLLPNLWSLLRFDSCQVAQACGTLFIHCLSCRQISNAFKTIITDSLDSHNWSDRYNAITKLFTMINFIEVKEILGYPPLQSTLAHTFSVLISGLSDQSPQVRILASIGFKNIKLSCIEVAKLCFHHQYINYPDDRPKLLFRLEQLQKCLPRIQVLRYDLFLLWFDVLPVGLDINDRQRFPYLSLDPTTYQHQNVSSKLSLTTTSKNRFKKSSDLSSYNPFKVSSSLRRSSSGRRSSTRRCSSIISSNSFDVTVAADNFSITDSSSSIDGVVIDSTSHKSTTAIPSQLSVVNDIDPDDMRNETMYRLIELFMQYLRRSSSTNSKIGNNNDNSQYHMKIFLCIQRLMGYNHVTQIFNLSSSKLRSSLIYKAFLVEAPLMLDTCLTQGKKLITFIVSVLHYCTYVQDTEQYTLLALSQFDRQNWFMTLLILLYKYNLKDVSAVICKLMELTTQMIETAHHLCHHGAKNNGSFIRHRISSKNDFSYCQSISLCEQRNSIKRKMLTKLNVIDTGDNQLGVQTTVVNTSTEIDERSVHSTLAEKLEMNTEIEVQQQSDSQSNRDIARTSGRARGTLRRERSFEEEPLPEIIDDVNDNDDFDNDNDSNPLHVNEHQNNNDYDIIDDAITQSNRKIKKRNISASVPQSNLTYNPSHNSRLDDIENRIFDITKCIKCGELISAYDQENICLGILVLSTFVYRYPEMAAPQLLRILRCIARITSRKGTLLHHNDTFVCDNPDHLSKVSTQVFKCILLQYLPHGIFPQLFKSHISDDQFLPAMAKLLSDFSEFDQMEPLYKLFEYINNNKITNREMKIILDNLANYMDNLSNEAHFAWQNVISHLDTFFKKLPIFIKGLQDGAPLARIMVAIFKLPTNSKNLLQSMGHCFAVALRNVPFSTASFTELCIQCYWSFAKEREKLYFTRCAVTELVHALKSRIILPADNFVKLAQLVFLDTVEGNTDLNFIDTSSTTYQGSQSNALELFRQYLPEAVEFLGSGDVSVRFEDLVTSKSSVIGNLKIMIAKIIAFEITNNNNNNNNNRDLKYITRLMPWFHQRQSQPTRFQLQECVSQVRIVCWLLVGSLHHYVESSTTSSIYTPFLPSDIVVIERVLNVFNSIASKGRESSEYLSAIPPILILCQLWTVYCEQYMNSRWQFSEFSSTSVIPILIDFWQEVTSALLQVVSEIHDLHVHVIGQFFTTVESLKECNSFIFHEYFPSWISFLSENCNQANRIDRLRHLQECTSKDNITDNQTVLKRWLHRVQLQMAQNELQATVHNNKSQYIV